MSTARGALIIGSVGLLIFLQGNTSFPKSSVSELKMSSSFQRNNALHTVHIAIIVSLSFYRCPYSKFCCRYTGLPRSATNISILTTTQSSIAADLDAFEKAIWFTSSYLIAMSSLAPLMGRLSQVLSARLCMFSSTILMCAGSIVTSTSASFNMFIVGRVLTGAGGAGILIVAIILVIQMTSAKRRGLYIGLANSGMTVGVSLGAVIAGALEPKIGWVSILRPHIRT